MLLFILELTLKPLHLPVLSRKEGPEKLAAIAKQDLPSFIGVGGVGSIGQGLTSPHTSGAPQGLFSSLPIGCRYLPPANAALWGQGAGFRWQDGQQRVNEVCPSTHAPPRGTADSLAHFSKRGPSTPDRARTAALGSCVFSQASHF